MSVLFDTSRCKICPRMCGADRNKNAGFCRSDNTVRAARYSLHMWEEPCISGSRGSGTVFFSGCMLRCVFCQNCEISQNIKGEKISDERLGEIFLRLRDAGAHNINLVNPTHYSQNIINALDAVGQKLGIPVVWNSGGYERAESIEKLEGKIDIFLPDLKYITPEISEKYSGAANYAEFAVPAIRKMIDIAGYPVFSDDGMMKSGVMIRHLVLPGNIKESFRVIDTVCENFDTDKLFVSIMCQYFPAYNARNFPEINRRLTTLEYQKVLEYAEKHGIKHGFCQEKSSAKEEYVPAFFDTLEDL